MQWEPGSVRRVLGGGEPILMEDQPPQPGPPPEPLASRNPEDLEWDGELRGEPHLRSGEVLRWRRQPDGDIRYVLSRVTDGETESVWYTFSPERTIGFVVQYFREQLDKYSLDKIDKAGHRGA
ncbi:hypothetical protein [Streptomonospora nanhaiensis]|uniref:hypothetical protein n=1 Tax=Streptomonospora nanhaiensis TaxID=1323731 RepID=UPI0020CAC449|nr:hypothetical protein [Streptomonospora nanhaiensis]